MAVETRSASATISMALWLASMRRRPWRARGSSSTSATRAWFSFEFQFGAHRIVVLVQIEPVALRVVDVQPAAENLQAQPGAVGIRRQTAVVDHGDDEILPEGFRMYHDLPGRLGRLVAMPDGIFHQRLQESREWSDGGRRLPPSPA